MTELLFWPAALAYGEASVAYVAGLRRPGFSAQLAVWGVRIGWLAQTAFLAAQAIDAGGFPWTDAAGALYLFVWLLVGAYLYWGCTTRYRLLGVVILPLALVLLIAAHLVGVDTLSPSDLSSAFLVLHVGALLASFAGFALVGALAGLYLIQERRLKRHDRGILRVPGPPLVALERFCLRLALVSWGILSVGIAAGVIRIVQRGTENGLLIGLTVGVWMLFAGYLLLRGVRGWSGRRAAWIAVAGGALVGATLLTMTLTHA